MHQTQASRKPCRPAPLNEVSESLAKAPHPSGDQRQRIHLMQFPRVRVALRHSQRRVTEDFLNDPDADTLFEEQGRGRVPCVVKASVAYVRLCTEPFPVRPVVPGLPRFSESAGKA